MPTLKITVQVGGRPLRRAYVEHLLGGFGGDRMYLTDDDGRIEDEDGNPGVESVTAHADLRVLGQNSVVKVLDGATPGPLAVNQDFPGCRDGDVIDITGAARQVRHYDLLNRFVEAYDVALRQFQAFGELPDPDFPLGRKATLRATKDQARRIEVTFPSQLPGAAFTEPSSAATGFPLVHVHGPEFAQRGLVVPSELPHGLHFARFSAARRTAIETDYAAWLAVDVANGGDGRHHMGKRTSPKVAYIEAIDHFCHRFCEYVRLVEQGGAPLVLPQPMTAQLRNRFLAREFAGPPVVPVFADSPQTPATLDGSGNVVPNPNFHGSDDEGSVYGCIFLDFGRRIGLRTAVNAYFRSASRGVTTFGGYRNVVADTRPDVLAELDAARETWGL